MLYNEDKTQHERNNNIKEITEQLRVLNANFVNFIELKKQEMKCNEWVEETKPITVDYECVEETNYIIVRYEKQILDYINKYRIFDFEKPIKSIAHLLKNKPISLTDNEYILDYVKVNCYKSFKSFDEFINNVKRGGAYNE